jgi:hypothetical protein
MPWPNWGLCKTTPKGIRVFLRHDTWFNHIKVDHSELANYLGEVLETIEHPESVHADRNAYISFRFSEKLGMYIMVVYSAGGHTSKVKTAYTSINPYIEVASLMRVWPI